MTSADSADATWASEAQQESEQKARAELIEKLKDREWRLDNLYYIQNKAGEKVKFRRNHSQMMFWNAMWFMNIILKDRQRGFSTLMAIYILDTCLFNSNTNAGIIDISLSDAKKKLAKIQFAYDALPEWLRQAKPLKTSNKETIEFAHDSSVQVGTSHRGGTLQILHISELGKIAAKFPEKAKEIRTGALNTIAPGQVVVIESTAEGAFGEFYDICKGAMEFAERGSKLTKLDWKFHFFGWWMKGRDEEYIDPDGVVITDEDARYFEGIEEEFNVELTPEQKAWYVKKAHQQQDEMQREYPSSPEEAFAVAVEGGIFTKQLSLVRKQGRLGRVPIIPHLPVNTFWDLGGNDLMTIWFHQWARDGHHFVHYYENHLEGYDFYAKYLNEYAEENGIRYGYHYAPHDISQKKVTSVYKSAHEHAAESGIHFQRVDRIANKADAWNAGRKIFYACWFDEVGCGKGWRHLCNYRLKWDMQLQIWRKEAVHDESSHGADGWLTFAQAMDAHMVPQSVPVGGITPTNMANVVHSPGPRDPFERM